MGRLGRQDLTGRLLVATPDLQDPNFFRTVVLLIAHGDEGAVGVVLNRPLGVSVVEAAPGWEGLAAGPAVLFAGGPVAGDSVVCMGRARRGATPQGFAQVGGELGTLGLSQDPHEAARHVEVVRLFVGYAGWGPGQLESERAQGAWYVVDAEPSDAFDPRPADLWRGVLRRQGGVLAMVATIPDDPSLN